LEDEALKMNYKPKYDIAKQKSSKRKTKKYIYCNY